MNEERKRVRLLRVFATVANTHSAYLLLQMRICYRSKLTVCICYRSKLTVCICYHKCVFATVANTHNKYFATTNAYFDHRKC